MGFVTGIKKRMRGTVKLPHPVIKWMRRFFVCSTLAEQIRVDLVGDPVGVEICRLIDEGCLEPKMNLCRGVVQYFPTPKLHRRETSEWFPEEGPTITPLRRALILARLRKSFAETGYAMRWSSTRYETSKSVSGGMRLDAVALLGPVLLGVRVLLSSPEEEHLKMDVAYHGKHPKIDAMLYLIRSFRNWINLKDSVKDTGESYFLSFRELMTDGAEATVRNSPHRDPLRLREFLETVENQWGGNLKKGVEKKPLPDKIHHGSKFIDPVGQPHEKNPKTLSSNESGGHKIPPPEPPFL